MRPLKSLASLLLFSLVCISSLKAQTTIYDIQYVDPSSGSDVSTYVNQTVTVSGIVTASIESGNLGTFFIQQPDIDAWAGIQLDNAIGLSATEMGDIIEVTGKVIEEDGVTKITSITKVDIRGKGNIVPVTFNPDAFTSSSLAKTEQYEGMLVSLANAPQPIYVVNSNPNAPNNNGEWRVGSNLNDVNIGCRILSGRQTSEISSSLNVSYINHIQWATNSGVINVAPTVVNNGNQFFGITGIMTYNEGNIVLLPRNNEDFTKSVVGVFEQTQPIKALNVFPNPINNIATVQFETEKPTSLEVTLYDLQGKIVQFLSSWKDLSVGFHTKKIEFNDQISPGNYILSIQGEEINQTKMISIQ